MALQTKADLETLDVVGPFGVFCRVAAKGTETEAIGPFGVVFVLPATTTDPTNVVYVKTGASTWSTATAIYIKTGSGTWNVLNEFNVKTNSGWNGVGDNLYSGVSSVFLVTTNLIFYLDASNSSSYPGSGTTWTDLSSSSNNGTLTNGPTFDSGNSGSIVFDGTNDRIQTSSDMFNPNSDFTISAWVNLDTATGTTNYTIVSDHINSGSFQLRYKNGTGVQLVDSIIVNVGAFSNSTLSTGTWYNITVTRSSDTYTLYLNGSSTSSFTNSNTYTRGPQSIGSNRSTTSEYWDGKIAQVLAYSSALSASDVAQNYNGTKSTYGY